MQKLIYIRDESELLDWLNSGFRIVCATHLTDEQIIGPPGVGYIVEEPAPAPEKPKPAS